MKVGIYAEDLEPSVGGGHTLTVEIVRALGRARPRSPHELVVYTRGDARGDVDLGGLPVERVDDAALGGAVRKLQRGVRAVAELAGPKVARHAQTIWHKKLASDNVKLLWSPGPLVPLFDVPFAVTIWDLQHRVQPWFPEVSSDGERAYRERTISEALHRAMRVVVGTTAGAAEVERYYAIPPNRIRMLPHPTPRFALDAAPDETGDDAVIARLGVPRPFIVYPAQLWPHKNHATLLEALRVLDVDHGVHVSLALAGSDRGQAAPLRARAEQLGVASRMHLLGFVSQRDLIALYRCASALAYPSWFGPENLPPLEAFALGCPVVAACVDGSAEQLGDAALLVDPLDARGFATALARVLTDDVERNRLIERGCARATRTTTDDFATGALDLIDEMARVRSTWA